MRILNYYPLQVSNFIVDMKSSGMVECGCVVLSTKLPITSLLKFCVCVCLLNGTESTDFVLKVETIINSIKQPDIFIKFMC